MMDYKYKIFSPGGNDTALVFGIEMDIEKRRAIQDDIIAKHSNVEQVGFISEEVTKPQLMMTGGEFCGNAARTAAWHYLQGQAGEIDIQVSGVDRLLRAGITDTLQTWTEMPVASRPNRIKNIGDGLYWVQLDGISHLVVSQRRSDEIFRTLPTMDADTLKKAASDLIDKYELGYPDAYGVMFTETVLNMVKIHPCVFIKTAGTSYYETACGSGSVAVGLVASVLLGKGTELALLQPSDKVITSLVEYSGGIINGAKISGVVEPISNILSGGYKID